MLKHTFSEYSLFPIVYLQSIYLCCSFLRFTKSQKKHVSRSSCTLYFLKAMYMITLFIILFFYIAPLATISRKERKGNIRLGYTRSELSFVMWGFTAGWCMALYSVNFDRCCISLKSGNCPSYAYWLPKHTFPKKIRYR